MNNKISDKFLIQIENFVHEARQQDIPLPRLVNEIRFAYNCQTTDSILGDARAAFKKATDSTR